MKWNIDHSPIIRLELSFDDFKKIREAYYMYVKRLGFSSEPILTELDTIKGYLDKDSSHPVKGGKV